MPHRKISPHIIKYTGALASPEWKDIDPGRVFSLPWYLVKNTQSQKDKFETLCSVKADISGARYTKKLVETGKMGYKRDYNIILLVGLTELKAQVSWIDSKTVRSRLVLHVPVTSYDFHMCKSRGKREGL